jgi:hypothetical protein
VGRGVLALIDTDTLRVEGYFEETKLQRIRVGDAATIHLMGEHRVLSGRVEGNSRGNRGQGKIRGFEPSCQCKPDVFMGAIGSARSGPHQAR